MFSYILSYVWKNNPEESVPIKEKYSAIMYKRYFDNDNYGYLVKVKYKEDGFETNSARIVYKNNCSCCKRSFITVDVESDDKNDLYKALNNCSETSNYLQLWNEQLSIITGHKDVFEYTDKYKFIVKPVDKIKFFLAKCLSSKERPTEKCTIKKRTRGVSCKN